MTDQDRIAAFLANKGATVCKPAPAYGVDRELDKARRAEARHSQYVETECDHDARMEAAHDAFFVGDREGGHRLLSERRLTREPICRGDGRRVIMNRY